MALSTGLKGDYFKKSSGADNTLPEEFDSNTPASSDGEDKQRVPPSTQLKADIAELERTEEEGNLYSTFKAQRMTRRERDSDLAERFLHPDLQNNDRVSIQKYKRDNYKRGLQRQVGEQPFPV